MAEFSGLGMDLGNLSRLSRAKSKIRGAGIPLRANVATWPGAAW